MKLPNDSSEKLQSLLGCKRYEQPPPGYFYSFPDRIRAQIESEEFVEYSSLWQWFVNKFDAKPVVACVYGVALSSLLIAGFSVSQVFDSEAALSPVIGGPWLGWTPPTDLMGQKGITPNPQFLETSNSMFPSALVPQTGLISSSLVPGTSLSPQPVTFTSFQ